MQPDLRRFGQAGIDWVLFDAGGTLITIDYDRVRAALDSAGAGPDDAAFERSEAVARRWADVAVRSQFHGRALWDGYFARVMEGAGVSPAAVPDALDALWRANRELGLWRRPLPEAIGVMRTLKDAGRRMAVVSNAEGQVEADLVAAGFGEFLETVVDSHLVGVAKPDPRIFAICLERIGARPDQCIYVGDVPAFDVDGARAAGIRPVLLDPHDVHAPAPDVVRIRRLSELPALLGIE